MTSSALPYLMRIEGVNLGRFVFDTRDLSTIRGGGLMLLEAVDTACAALKKFTAPLNVRTISQGASIGLFEFDLPSEKKEDAEKTVLAALASKYPHATFVVDAVPASNNFRENSEKLLALNRWRQMQSATLLAPIAVNDPPEFVPACELDGVRPARKGLQGREPDILTEKKSATFLSEATKRRRKFGSEAKQKFYEKQLDKANLAPVQLEHEFASEFEHIAQRKAKPLEGKPLDGKTLEREPLDGKLAVFYADGNQFGAIQRKLCDKPERQAAWDHYIRTERAKFLRAFLEEELMNAPDGWVFLNEKNESFYRFETLLWGGDELLFVMPAWKGWQFAARFFQATAGWNASAANLEDGSRLGEQPLTHTAALVFCQHHAPIHRIKNLSKDKMAESAKEIKEGSKPIGRERNQLVYQVLESMDHLGSSYKAALAERYRDKAKLHELVLADDGEPAGLGDKLAKIAEIVDELRKSDFPRSQLRALVHKWLHGGKVKSFGDAVDAFARTSPKCGELLAPLKDVLGSELPLWLHLEELWDYAAP